MSAACSGRISARAGAHDLHRFRLARDRRRHAELDRDREDVLQHRGKRPGAERRVRAESLEHPREDESDERCGQAARQECQGPMTSSGGPQRPASWGSPSCSCVAAKATARSASAAAPAFVQLDSGVRRTAAIAYASSRERRCASFLRSRAHEVPMHRMQRRPPSGSRPWCSSPYRSRRDGPRLSFWRG